MSGFNTTRYRLCSCKWPNCEETRNSAMTTLPEDHVWCQNIMRIVFKNRDPNTMSIKQFALYNCIRRHILKDEVEKIVPSAIFLYPHHFPISLLKWMNENNNAASLTQSLSYEEAGIVDAAHLGTQRFLEDSNSVYFYNMPGVHGFHNISRKECKTFYQKQYMKAPLTLPNEIEFVLHARKGPQKRNLQLIHNASSKKPCPTSPPIVPDINSLKHHNATNKKPRPTSPPIVPDINSLKHMLIEKHKLIQGNILLFSKKKSVIEIAKLLTRFHGNFDVIQLTDDNIFYPCIGNTNQIPSNCQSFKILTKRYSRTVYCDSCLILHNQTRNRRRTIESPTRSRPFTSLTPEDQKVAYQKAKYGKKVVDKRIGSWIEKMKLKKGKLCFTENSPAKEQLKEACKFIKDNWMECKNDLMYTLLEVQNVNETGKKEKIFSDIDRNNLISYLTDSITNLSFQLNGKGSQCRYSNHAINLSMSLFLKNKSMYKELRENKDMSLPSSVSLYKKQSLLKPSPGADPTSMLFIKDLKQRTQGKIQGHLMMDEIKLKNGIMWNCMNNTVTGFIGDELNTKDIMMDILGLSPAKKKSNQQMMAYANQWRFRSTKGHVHNAFYYFNKGSLTCNDLAEQFTDVLLYYESLGIEIHGVVCDGGGSNMSFLHKIVEFLDFDSEVIDEKTVSMIHPFDTNRRIYFWSCGTHSQKAIRNNLFRSKINGTKNLKLNNSHFGWSDVETIYSRDEDRFKKGNYKRTDIVNQTVYLDSFTMMNATYAKQPFSSKTISEVLSYFSVKCNVKYPLKSKFPSEWHKYFEFTQLLKPAIDKISIAKLSSEYSLLQYQVTIFGIYIERLLNRQWKLTVHNMAYEESVLKSIVTFFYQWKNDVTLSNMKNGVRSKEGEKFFIAKKTFQNLLSLVYGFMGYAKQILRMNNKCVYVPALHCNQSSIEGLFSHIRANDKDRTDRYGYGIMQQNISSFMKRKNMIINSTSYPHGKCDVSYTRDNTTDEKFCIELLYQKTLSAIKTIDILVSKCLSEKICSEDTCILPSGQVMENKLQGILMLPKLKQFVLLDGKSYQQYMADDKSFVKIMHLMHGSKAYKWFENLLKYKTHKSVNRLCQHINLRMYNLYCDSHNSKDEQGQFNLCMMREMQKEKESSFEDMFKTYVPNMCNEGNDDRLCRWLIINWLKGKFFDEWVPKVIEQMKSMIGTSTSSQLSNLVVKNIVVLNDGDVNRMFGWALFKVKKNL